MHRNPYISEKIKSRLRGWHRDTGWRLGLNQSFFKSARGAKILVYHGICQHHPFAFNTLFVTSQSFENQLKLFKKYFHLISLNDLYEDRLATNRFNLCLSFDDGFANNHKYVLPLLEKYEVPACFFLTGVRHEGYDILWNDLLALLQKLGPTELELLDEIWIRGLNGQYRSSTTGNLLSQQLRFTSFEPKAELMERWGKIKYKASEEYWLQMDEEQIREISKSKWVTLGSHGYYHNDLGKIPGTLVKEELQQSKTYLESLTGKEIRSLAFPYGSYSKEAVRIAKDCGYSQILATEFLFDEDHKDPEMKERLIINPFITSINQMHATIRGNYE